MFKTRGWGGSKAVWTMFKKTALLVKDGFPNITSGYWPHCKMMIISWPSPQTPNTEENTIMWQHLTRHLHDLDQDGGVEADDFHLYHHLCRQSRPCHGAWSGIYHKDNAMTMWTLQLQYIATDHGSFPMTIFRPSPCPSVTLPWRRSVSLTSMVGGHWSAIIQHDYNDQNYHSWWLWRILLFSIPRGLQWVHNNYWLLQVNVWLIDCPDCPLIVQMSRWSTRSKKWLCVLARDWYQKLCKLSILLVTAVS